MLFGGHDPEEFFIKKVLHPLQDALGEVPGVNKAIETCESLLTNNRPDLHEKIAR